MSLTIIEGAWEGFFTYGPDYPIEYQSIKEVFTMELSVVDGIIKGACVDSFIKKYFDEPAKVEGTLIDGVLSLIKKYPYFLGVDEYEQTYVDKALPSHEVHYRGQMKRKLFSSEYFVEGQWDISGSFLDEEGTARYYTDEGDWEMHRVK